MTAAAANGLTIEYESLGDPAAPPILLIMGLGMQLIAWPDAFCQGLVDRGFRVIRFDNRDAGLSSKIRVRRQPSVVAALAASWLRLPVRAPYTLEDMAADSVGLLDALGIARVHVVGLSMGGMIAQIVAAAHADRVRSLTSIMSSSGSRKVSQPRPDAKRAILSKPPDPGDPESVVRHLVGVFGVIGSPGYPTDRQELHAQISRIVRRGYYPAGVTRQLVAIIASGDRRTLLRRIAAPTLVIHGEDDPLVPVEAGRDTARHIEGARLMVIPGMGHDLAPGLLPILVDASPRIAGSSRNARARDPPSRAGAILPYTGVADTTLEGNPMDEQLRIAALEYHRLPTAGQDLGHADQGAHQPARPRARLLPGRSGGLRRDRGRSAARRAR